MSATEPGEGANNANNKTNNGPPPKKGLSLELTNSSSSGTLESSNTGPDEETLARLPVALTVHAPNLDASMSSVQNLTRKTTVIKINLPDGTGKMMPISADATGESMLRDVADKLGLSQEAAFAAFSLCITGLQSGLEIDLPLHVHPRDIVDNWNKWELEYKGFQSKEHPVICLRRKQLLSLGEELQITDERAVELLFMEAHDHVLRSRYVFSEKKTKALMALQIQSVFGDFDKDKHKAGYFSDTRIADIAPIHEREGKGFKPAKWEKAVLKQYESLKGTTRAEAISHYLAQVRECPYYGCVLFDAVMLTGKAAKAAKLTGPVVLAISRLTVCLIRPADFSVAVVVDRDEPGTSHRVFTLADVGAVFRISHVDGKGKQREYQMATQQADLIINLLDGVPTTLLTDASEFIEALLPTMTSESYRAGEYIIRWRDIGRCMYFLKSGTCEVEQLPGDSHSLITLSPGSYFGEIALFISSTGTRTASIRAQTDVEVHVLSKDVLNKVLHRFPRMNAAFRELGEMRLRRSVVSEADKKGPPPTPGWLTRLSTMSSSSVHVAAPGGNKEREMATDPPTFCCEIHDMHNDEAAGEPLLDPCSSFLVNPAHYDVFSDDMDVFSAVVENPDAEVDWFRRFFAPNAHDVFLAKLEEGVVAVTVVTSTNPDGQRPVYWVIAWRGSGLRRFCVEADGDMGLGEILEVFAPELAKSAKAFRRLDDPAAATAALCNIENSEPDLRLKVGVLLALEGQTDENDMFGNIDSTPAFDEFLDVLGDTVVLEGYTGYSAQLDTKNNQSGTHSVATTFGEYDVMYHVSTMMQYDANDEQHIQRKRFIGNDIVVVVFVDGSTTYQVTTMKSQYTNILMVVQPDATGTMYRFQDGYNKGLRRYGPPSALRYPRDGCFKDFLLAKCINGEKAAKASPEFQIREKRTRSSYLDILHSDHAEATKKSTELVADRHMLDELPEAPAQAFTIDTTLSAFSEAIRATHAVYDLVFLGTDAGLYVCDSSVASDAVFIAKLSNIRQISSDLRLGLLFVLIRDGEPGSRDYASRLVAFGLAELLRGDPPVVALIPHTKKVASVSHGWVDDRFFLAANNGSAVYVFTTRTDSSFRLAETLRFEGKVASVTVLEEGLFVGVAGRRAAFHFFDLVGETLHVYDALYEATDGDVPLGAFAVDYGVLLCFSRYGVLIREDGKVDRTFSLNFTCRPVHVCQYGPFLAVYGRNYVEIVTTINGAVVETHRLAVREPFWCPNGALYVPTVLVPTSTGKARDMTALYHLVPIVGGAQLESDARGLAAVMGASFIEEAVLGVDSEAIEAVLARLEEEEAAAAAAGDGFSDTESEVSTLEYSRTSGKGKAADSVGSVDLNSPPGTPETSLGVVPGLDLTTIDENKDGGSLENTTQADLEASGMSVGSTGPAEDMTLGLVPQGTIAAKIEGLSTRQTMLSARVYNLRSAGRTSARASARSGSPSATPLQKFRSIARSVSSVTAERNAKMAQLEAIDVDALRDLWEARFADD